MPKSSCTKSEIIAICCFQEKADQDTYKNSNVTTKPIHTSLARVMPLPDQTFYLIPEMAASWDNGGTIAAWELYANYNNCYMPLWYLSILIV